MAEVIVNSDTESAIDEFGKKYEAERNQWQTFLQYVHTKCEDSLRGRVQASVTSRVKYWDSLRKKLEKINEKQNYREVTDIEADEKLDIAGVRIRAFFPKQLSEVYKIVEEIFDVKTRKQFERDWKDPDKLESYEERFGNYEGRHYWVKLKTNDSELLHTELRKRFNDQVIEIQVRSSMLLDSWAEVRHDITYKSLGGKPSRAEREVLDSMKGVVKSMEVLLDHLFDVHEDRVKSDDTKLEAMPLLEQALVRALPQLSQSHEKIVNMPVLHTFLMTSSIDTPGRIKERIRKSKFPDEWIGFCESRELSKQPVWTFILEQIFMTLSREELKEILSKILEKSELDQVFCRSISWLEEYLFTKEHIQLKPDEIKRCNMIWYVHEYISATWPERKPNLCSLLEDMLCYVKESPAPRVDNSLYVAIALTLSGVPYELPETEILEKLRNPNLMRKLRECVLTNWWVSDMFRWHRHDSFRDHVNTSVSLQKIVQNSSVEESCCVLLKIATSRLSGAMLHRAVSHSDKDKNVEVVEQLLEAPTDIDVNFVNASGQSTLHAATIFSPSVETVKKILASERVNVNKADKNGETALLAALILRKNDSLSCLLDEASINVNIRGGSSPESLALYHWDASLSGYMDPYCQPYLPEVGHYRHEPGCYCSIREKKTVAEYWAPARDWSRLKRIVQNSSFTILDSFRDWTHFFQCTKPDVRVPGGKTCGDEFREIFLDPLKKDVNKLDKRCNRSLDMVLKSKLSDEKDWVNFCWA